MDYGFALESEAEWHLGLDVYGTIVEHFDVHATGSLVVDALNRRGACFRELGELAGAAATHETARNRAIAIGFVSGELRAQIGVAKNAVSRGNLPRADEILTDTVHRASIHSLTEVWSRATHARGETSRLNAGNTIAPCDSGTPRSERIHQHRSGSGFSATLRRRCSCSACDLPRGTRIRLLPRRHVNNPRVGSRRSI